MQQLQFQTWVAQIPCIIFDSYSAAARPSFCSFRPRTDFCQAEKGDYFLPALSRLIIGSQDLKLRPERRPDAFNCIFDGLTNFQHWDQFEFLSDLCLKSFITKEEIILSLSTMFSLLLFVACVLRPSSLARWQCDTMHWLVKVWFDNCWRQISCISDSNSVGTFVLFNYLPFKMWNPVNFD